MIEEQIIDLLEEFSNKLQHLERTVIRKSLVITGTTKAEFDVLRDSVENLADVVQIEIEDYEDGS